MIGGPVLGLETVLTMTATLERNDATEDDAGGRQAPNWQPVANVPCFLWFGTGTAATRIGQTRPRPEETVDLNIGGMIMPAGTDITARDRIATVTDKAGNQAAGLLEILAVAPFEGLTELSFRQVS